MITVRMSGWDRLDHFADTLDLVFAYMTGVFLILTPIIVYYYGKRLLYRRLGMREDEAAQITSLFDQYREDDIAGIRFTLVFFIRRFIMILIMTLLPG